MAIISTLFSDIPGLSYKVFLALVTYWCIHILSQWITPLDPKKPPVVRSYIPFLGSALEFGKDPILFLQTCQKKYGNVFTFQLLNKRVTACLGPEGNQFVFNAKQDVASAAAAYNHMTKPVFGDDVVFDTAHSIFMEQKKIIKSGLNEAAFRQHVHLISEECNQFFKTFDSEKSQVDLFEMFGTLIIYTASRALLGPEIRQKMDSGVAKLYYDLDQGFRPINFMFPSLPLPVNFRRDLARKKLADTYREIIQNRRQSGKRHEDLVQTLMDARYKTGEPIPDPQICGILTSALFGGQHTSSTTSAWAMLELSQRPEIVQALREEMVQVMGSLHTEFTLDHLSKLTLLENVIRETLRLHPPIFNMMRRVVAPTVEHAGKEIPAGDYLLAAPGVTQLDARFFDQPKEWNPARWSDGKDPIYKLHLDDTDAQEDYGFGAVGISSNSPFLPFGAGRHRCIGERFGYLQLKIILGSFIQRYDVNTPYVPQPDYTSLVVVPKHSQVSITPFYCEN